MTDTLLQIFLDAVLETFRGQKSMGERALAQLSTQQLHETPTYDANSPAVIVKHMYGNMRSRWTDFLTSDGEKPDRNRDDEFVDDDADKAEVLRRWNNGWSIVLSTIEALTPDDLERTIMIRGQPHSVPRAILRQIDHYGYHTGQIVLLCKHIVGEGWQTLSVPRAGTAAFNASLGYDPKA
ncbi:MAG: DUF1572 family protein [Phycisphaerales bacterium JB050]